MKNKKAILIPGTFLPVTNAHLAIGKLVSKLETEADVYYIPSNIDFMRRWKDVSDFMTDEERLNLLKAVVSPLGFEALGIEMDGTVSGKTYDTAEYMRGLGYEDIIICFGADKLPEIDRWYKADSLLSENRFIFLSRDKQWESVEKEKVLEKIRDYRLVEMEKEFLDISATEVRNAFYAGSVEKIREDVPKQVFDYLKERLEKMGNKYEFNAEETTNNLIEWIRDWFDKNGKDCKAVIGISGGKDSTVVAGLMAKALGKDRVVGVMMPNGTQYDISDSYHVCEFLDIPHYEVNIKAAYDGVLAELEKISVEPTKQTLCNLPPRLRMSTLYAISQSLNGRVINTCNLSETVVSWETRWGDAVGDMSPLAKLTVQEVKAIGKYLGLPIDLVDKAPSDGLCGSTDEDALGVKYLQIDEVIRTGSTEDKEAERIVLKKYNDTMFKRLPIPVFDPEIKNCLE